MHCRKSTIVGNTQKWEVLIVENTFLPSIQYSSTSCAELNPFSYDLCRNASKKEITKAYRKLAAEWHPDRYDGKEKEEAEKKFIDIAAAKEVLTDPEKRQKFDNGEDPLDPEEQAQGGGPFWHQGFNPFGGGGFQFKFHF